MIENNNYLYHIIGTVTYGKQLGRTVGMPTANIIPKCEIHDIPTGVYAAVIEIDGILYQGITHVGRRPSVDIDSTITVETYIFDFTEDIYDITISLFLYLFIRDTIDFASLEEVKAQVNEDICVAKQFLANINFNAS